jgi:hypothetical protein
MRAEDVFSSDGLRSEVKYPVSYKVNACKSVRHTDCKVKGPHSISTPKVTILSDRNDKFVLYILVNLKFGMGL